MSNTYVCLNFLSLYKSPSGLAILPLPPPHHNPASAFFLPIPSDNLNPSTNISLTVAYGQKRTPPAPGPRVVQCNVATCKVEVEGPTLKKIPSCSWKSRLLDSMEEADSN